MNLKDFKIAPFYALDKEWALITAGSKDGFNMMTISWGGFGTLWHKPVVTVYVRPIRYTYEFLENNDYFTISFYDDTYKNELSVLGSKSGRDIDKLSLTSLTPEYLEKGITFKESKLTIVCKKVYEDDLDINKISEENKKFYQTEPVPTMFIGEVIDIIDKRG